MTKNIARTVFLVRCCLAPIFAALGAGFPGHAAEWQWSVEVKSEKPEYGPARAFLWIPPNCEKVRGIVIAQHNMEEISILEHAGFRQAMAGLGFAEVWVAPMFDHSFRFDRGAGDTLNDLLEWLAAQSGYSELSFAPLVPMGHSAAASWPYNFAAWNPGRALAALSVSGQWPYVRDKSFAPDIWGDRTIDFIPCLETMGEYEAANTWSREGLKERQEHPKLPLSMLACPAEGHFASSDAKAEFLAFYIRKAVQYRLPKDWTGDAPPRLLPVDPTTTGWLADKWRLNQPPTAPPAPVGKFEGNPGEAFWFFDEETARAVQTYQARHRGKKPQLVGILQDGKLVPQTETHLQLTPKFKPEADGITFKLTGVFYDSVPSGSHRLPDWTQLPANSPLGHASSGAISIDVISGPMKKISADTFALDLKRETQFSTNARNYELVFAVTHPGDAEYKPAVQQAHIFAPPRNTQGAGQRLDFDAIPDQEAGVKEVKLKATSDAGLPVRFYVREGPAEVDGDTLKLTPLPPRAKHPVKVTVIAWQYGRSIEPRVKSADPVERSFYITKPQAPPRPTPGR